LGLRLGDFARVIAQGTQFGRDGSLGRKFVIDRAFLHNQLPANLGRSQACIQAIGAEIGIGLALRVDQRLYVSKQVRQVVFGTFATAQREGVHTLEAAFEFLERFAQGLPIPVQFTLGLRLATTTEFVNSTSHKSPAFVSFKRLGGLDQPDASALSEFEHTTSSYPVYKEYEGLNDLDFLIP